MKKKRYALMTAALIAGFLLVAATGAQAEFREKGPAIIGLKGPNALQFEAHGLHSFSDRYMLVSRLTRFYNEIGEPVSLADLKIPCQATVHYKKRASDGLCEAISINVEYYFEDREVSTDWSLPEIKPLPPQ